MISRKKSTPEAMGIPSVSLSNFIQKLKEHGIPMHSLLMARHGTLVLEGYYAPYDADKLHRMFSVSKSLTSIAIGLLNEKGFLSLDDPIVNYFPEYAPNEPHPHLASMTIRHMLTMQTCYSATTFKNDLNANWIESFFTTTPSHRPGTVFNYDTSATHTLCGLVEKLTGHSLLNYLRITVFDQIGFSQDAYMLKDPFGNTMGGSGLMAKSMDLMEVALLLMNDGAMAGTQLLPKDYMKAAVSYQVNTAIHGPTIEEQQGYGYQFWRIRHNGFACYGMGGQLVICLPDQDLIVVTTADTQSLKGGNQMIYNSLFEEVLPHLADVPLQECPKAWADLNEQIKALEILPLTGSRTLEVSKVFEDRGKCFKLKDNAAGFKRLLLRLSEKDHEGNLTFFTDEGPVTLPFGLGKLVIAKFPIYEQECASSGVWLNAHSFRIKSHIIDESIGSVDFHLTFHEDHLSVHMKKIEETSFNEFSGYLESIH